MSIYQVAELTWTVGNRRVAERVQCACNLASPNASWFQPQGGGRRCRLTPDICMCLHSYFRYMCERMHLRLHVHIHTWWLSYSRYTYVFIHVFTCVYMCIRECLHI